MNLCYNYNTSKNKNQDCNLNIYDPTPNRVIQWGLESYCYELTEAERKVLDLFFWLQNRYEDIYVSQITIGRILKLCRQTVNKIIAKLCRAGFIYKHSRYKTSCIYKVSSYFLIPAIRSKLSWCFSALKSFSLSIISSSLLQTAIVAPDQALSPKATLINSNLFINTTATLSATNIFLEKDKKQEEKGQEELKKLQISKKDKKVEEKKLNIPLSDAKLLAKARLNLTTAGIIDIHRFDDRAIIYALEYLKPGRKSKEHEYNGFAAEATLWHKNNKVLRRFQERDALVQAHPQEASGKMTYEIPKKDYSNRIRQEEQGAVANLNKQEKTKHNLNGIDPRTEYIPESYVTQDAEKVERSIKNITPEGLSFLGDLAQKWIQHIKDVSKEKSS